MQDTLLTIDIGNTRIKYAVFHDKQIIEKFSCCTQEQKKNKSKILFSEKLSISIMKHKIKKIIISNVVKELHKTFTYVIEELTNIKPYIINLQNNNNHIKTIKDINIKTVGTDRIANINASNKIFPNKNIIIIDIGTATTIDIINNDNVFIGGIILPGPSAITKSFSTSASLLPTIKFQKPHKLIETNTINSMESGLYHGYMNMLYGLISEINITEKAVHTVIVTGGYSNLIGKDILKDSFIDPNFTLKGIMYYEDQLVDYNVMVNK